ncbi:MAG: DUF1566 domain-containing protein, partial [Gammaproteobacteria bacterium]|nr:DUF1566 domain-containing protein [Gammaproteobacteria bacterium]
KPLVQQEVITAPVPEQKPTPTPAPVAVIPAPVVAKPQTKAPAPRKQVVTKSVPAKPAAVVTVKTVEKPRPATRKVTPPQKVVKKTVSKQLQTGFRKLGFDGRILPDDATEWACVQDRATGLIWEVKTDDNSIRDRDNFFTWYDPTNERNYGNPGARDGGRCKGDADCDTLAYTHAINQKRLCGFADWRLPVKDELLSLVEYHYGSKETKATINRKYFPHAVPSWYWSASSNPKRPDYAWFVLFRNGLALNALKQQPKHVRLVRGKNSHNEGMDKSRTQYLAHFSQQQ